MLTNLLHTNLIALCALGQTPTGNNDSKTLAGDDRLGVMLTTESGELREEQILVDGQPVDGLSSLAWSATIDGKLCRPQAGRRVSAAQPNSQEIAFEGAINGVIWRISYWRSGPGRVTKKLTFNASRDTRIDEISLWHSIENKSPIVPRTPLQDIAAIYRDARSSLFVSLDFPYSRIATAGDSTRVSYPPHQLVRAGEQYEAHSLTLGAAHLTGRMRHDFDEGETAAIDAYVQERFAPRFERPMVVSCSINNRYTQVRGDVVWATMKDHPTLSHNTDLLERELALMPRLGVEYYQVFPGVFDWGPDDPSAGEVARLMEVAHRNGVRMGDYSGTSSVFCAHYNEYRNHLDRPEWMVRGQNGQPAGGFCFGNSAFVNYYINVVVPNCKRFGFELHCLDFLHLQPCFAPDHGHPPGRDSLYQQVKGLVQLLEAINAISPQMMTWSNSGNWQDLLPKIAWSNPNLYLTDPFIVTQWQGLNMTRLLDDSRREQMVRLHWSHFIPYRFLTNCQYFFSQNSIVPDIRNYEYGALSTLAVTPNLCLAEIRPWLDRLTEKDKTRVVAFYAHWTKFVREHFDLWKITHQLGDEPGPNCVEIYSHAARDHGYIFLVNPQYWSRNLELPLDERLGFAATGPCEIAELYPVERLRLTPEGPFATFGSTLSMHVPAQQVMVLEVRPVPAMLASPRLYGLPGTIERSGTGYLIKTQGPQGETERCAGILPAGAPRITSADVRADVPRIAKRLWAPTPLGLYRSEEGAALLDVTFRGVAAPGELRKWLVHPGSEADGAANQWHKGFSGGEAAEFPLFAALSDEQPPMPLTPARRKELGLGPLAQFCGAFVDNAFSETQETWIDLHTDSTVLPPTTGPATTDPIPMNRHLTQMAKDARKSWWLQTRFTLPFMYMIGAEPAFDEHTILVLPMLAPEEAKHISAWINGRPLEVRLYRYPRNRSLGCYFADLVGSGAIGGENRLVIHLQF